MTTKEEKQHYLRESILNDNMDTDSFINFMEGDDERGADLDRYDIEGLKAKVKEFKETYPQRKGAKNPKGELLQNVERSVRGVESEDEDGNRKKPVEGEDEMDQDSKYYGRKDCTKL